MSEQIQEQQQQQEQAPVQQEESPKTTYPVTDPKVFGSPYWFLIHNTAATYPENPTRHDKMAYGMFMKFLLTHLPCEDPCRYNALEWNRLHPFNLSSREYFFRDTVDFHNHVNDVTGKSDQNRNYRDLLTASHECTNCNINTQKEVDKGQQPQNPVQQQGQPQRNVNDGQSLKESIELYKKTIRQMAEQMAKERGKPAPEIEFDKCPDGSDTSCITKDGKIFLNPNNFSIKTFFHEMDHYLALKEGKQVDDRNNPSADKFASEAIQTHFGSSKPSATGAPPPPVLSHERRKKKRSRRSRRRKEQEENPGPAVAAGAPQEVQLHQAEVASNPYRQVVTDVYGTGPYVPPTTPQAVPFDQMPQFRAALQQIQHEETEEKLEKYENSGVLSFLDPLYDYPAQLMGVDREDLNLIQTPVILANVSKTITDAYLTPIAQVGFSFIMGVIMMLGGIFLHGKIPPRDVLLMEMLGSVFFWDLIRVLNPKKLYQLKREIDRIQKIRTGGEDPFGSPQPLSLRREIFETPGAYQEREEQRDIPKALSPEEMAEAGKFWLRENRPGAKFGVLAGMPMSPSDAFYWETSTQPSPYQMPSRRGGTIHLPPYSIRDRYL